jgi:hypothetical protein
MRPAVILMRFAVLHGEFRPSAIAWVAVDGSGLAGAVVVVPWHIVGGGEEVRRLYTNPN